MKEVLISLGFKDYNDEGPFFFWKYTLMYLY